MTVMSANSSFGALCAQDAASHPVVARLAIDLAEPGRLAHIFGASAASQALADLGDATDDLFERLLRQQGVVKRVRRDAEGHWSALFQVAPGEFGRDVGEVCSTIETACCRLMRESLSAVLGNGSGRRVSVDVGVSLVASPGSEAPRPGVHASACQRLENLVYEEVDALLAQRSIRTLLQPLVRMNDRRVIGYEALSRGPQGSPLEQPDMLFNAAALGGRTVEMELLCARLALERTAGRLHSGCLLTLNLGPEALALALDELPLRGRSDVMLELTEHLPLDQVESLTGTIARLRAQGIGLVLDDTGCGFADMDAVRLLRPEIVKLCIAVIRNADRGSPFDTEIGATALHLRQLGHRVLAEGVETEPQHAALLPLGIELAQGWLYGRPRPVDEVLAG